MKWIFTRTLDAGPRQGFAVSRAVALAFRNHIRLVIAALVTSLLVAVATLSSLPQPGVAYFKPTPILLDAPTSLTVSATSKTVVSLSWTAPAGGATQYQVERSENISGSFVFIGNASGTTFNDTTVIEFRAYLYRVRAVGSGGLTSAPSNLALGTAISFEFSQLTGRQINARHFNDVRTAINAVRSVANLAPANWARGTLNGLEIKASDVQELRNKLDEALTVLAIPITAYEDAVLNTGADGTKVRAVHVEQLQARSTRGISESGASPTPTPCSTSTHKSVVGEFGPVIHLPLVPVHLSVLPDGRVLFWGRDKDIAQNGRVKDVGGRSEAYVWNISDGSNKTDVAVFRPSERNWYIINSSTGATRVSQWGLPEDLPAPGDYDGDGRGDMAIYRPSNNLWGIQNSSDAVVTGIGFGVPTDIRVQADYDRDGKTDIAVFRPSEGRWFVRQSSNQSIQITQWGQNGDIPVPGDYDRDRKTDIAIFRPSESTWYILKSSDGSSLIKQWGAFGDLPAPGDYNGDGATDLAVYNPGDGNWHVLNIIAQPETTQDFFVGLSASTVVPGDYDGDGKTDAAIFRPTGNWHIRKSSTGFVEVTSWGQNGDVPVPKDYDGMLRVANTTTNLFCSGHSFLPDGRLFVSGGHRSPHSEQTGERHTNIFDYRTNSWSRGPEMNAGRWYPYNVTLSTGETLIMSGYYWANEPKPNPPDPPYDPYDPNTPFPPGPEMHINFVPQVYTPGGQSLRNLDEPQLENNLSMYPYLHLTPEGKVFQAQSGFGSGLGFGRVSRLLDPTKNNSLVEQETRFEHTSGTSVLFHSGRKALIAGGRNGIGDPTTDAEFFDFESKEWTPMASMNSPRTHHTATILPDGKVLVTGGSSCRGFNKVDCAGQAMNAEMWDPTPSPASDPEYLKKIPWCKMAAYKEVRAYHSIAALLPDGRVLMGGGGLPGAVGEIDANGVLLVGISNGDLNDNERLFGHKNVEIYSPPYLFAANGNLAARPEITSAPTSISYGQTFSVGTSGAGSAPEVSLVRLASITHGFNQDQRQLFLSVIDSSGITVAAPANANQCPPGYYMLFVLNNGVPSVAKMVRVQ